jgi:hypothetical protein
MATREERRIDVLQRKLKSRTKHDGTPLPGFAQNVAMIRAEIAQLSISEGEDGDGE